MNLNLEYLGDGHADGSSLGVLLGLQGRMGSELLADVLVMGLQVRHGGDLINGEPVHGLQGRQGGELLADELLQGLECCQ